MKLSAQTLPRVREVLFIFCGIFNLIGALLKTMILRRHIVTLFLAACLLNTASAQVPAWEWGVSGGISDYDDGKHIAVDAAGNVVVVGWWRNVPNNLFGAIQTTQQNATGWDGFMAKFTSTGTVLWVYPSKYVPSDVATDAAGNIYVLGFGNGTFMMGSDTLTGANRFIAKFDPSGSPLWAKKLEYYTLGIGPVLSVDGAGDAYVQGEFEGDTWQPLIIGGDTLVNTNPQSYDVFIAKFSSSGSFLWVKSYGGDGDDAFSGLAVDADNNMIVTGGTTSPQLILGADTIRHSAPTNHQLFLAKIDPAGNVLWTKILAPGAVDAVAFGKPVTDNSNNIYMSLWFRDSILFFDTDTLVNPGFPGGAHLFVVKFTPGGSLVWAQVDTTTPAYAAGVFLRSATGEMYLVCHKSISGNNQPAVLKFDSLGNRQWLAHAPSTSSRYSYIIRDGAIDAAGDLYFSGTYYDSAGYLLLGHDTIRGGGIIIGKLDPDAIPCSASASFTSTNQQNNYTFQNTSTGDSLTYHWNFGDGGTSSQQNPTHTFAAGTYNVCLSISDAWVCRDTSCISITVAASQNLVWPGDANSDGIANNLDLLAIGAGFGVNGPVRPNATLNWVGQPATDWLLQLAGGANLKHVDCDGNGTIGFSDVPAIQQNYGLTHAKGGSQARSAIGDLYFVFPRDSFFAGDTVSGAIHLGRAAAPVNNVYGLAFSLRYDQSFVDSGSVRIDFVNSWMAPDNNRVSLTKDLFTASKMDAALSRINHTNISGAGKIADVTFVIQDNIDGKDFITLPLEIQFENVQAIDKDEAAVPITLSGDTLYITDEISGVGNMDEQSITIFPNPTQHIVTVRSPDVLLSAYRISDIAGREILSARNLLASQLSIDLSGFSQGVYFITLQSAGGHIIQRKLTVIPF